MRFSDVIRDVKVISTNITNLDFCFNKICSNSNDVSFGDIFICKCGSLYDGHDYIKQAYLNGARTVVSEKVTDCLKENPNIRYITVEDSRAAEAKMLCAAYGYPARNMRLIAVTGTNGKTSTAYMIKEIFDRAGSTVGMIGTVKNYAGETDITESSEITCFSSMTTPSPAELYKLLAKMKSFGVDTVVMEASSHALSQKRLDGLHFDLGIFTNLTEDHLDYHKTISEYRNAKAHLFDLCSAALINTDCENGKILFDSCTAKKYSYSLHSDSDFKAAAPLFKGGISRYSVNYNDSELEVSCPIPGEFTVYNSLAALGAALICNIDAGTAVNALKNLKQIPGRLEKVHVPESINVYIDYAHTPDALEKVLETLKADCGGRLFTVFGCGGDREREKRPIMGRIATNISDFTIITEDNSRTENVKDIIRDIVSGIKSSSYTVIEDRGDAIRYALSRAKDGDTVLLAGKGHEDYEIKGNKKRHFSEKNVIDEYYNK